MDSLEVREALEQHYRESYGWALCCCNRDRTQAEDVMQNVYLKILEGKALFNGRSSFKTWIFAVIRKTAASEHRRAVLRKLHLLSYDDARPEPAVEDHTFRDTELHGLFQQALHALPKRQRETLNLVFYHDLRLTEAAGVMGISVGSARTHYERGKQRLRKWMEETNVTDEFRLARTEN